MFWVFGVSHGLVLPCSSLITLGPSGARECTAGFFASAFRSQCVQWLLPREYGNAVAWVRWLRSWQNRVVQFTVGDVEVAVPQKVAYTFVSGRSGVLGSVARLSMVQVLRVLACGEACVFGDVFGETLWVWKSRCFSFPPPR